MRKEQAYSAPLMGGKARVVSWMGLAAARCAVSRGLWDTVHCSSFIVHCSLFIVHRSSVTSSVRRVHCVHV